MISVVFVGQSVCHYVCSQSRDSHFQPSPFPFPTAWGPSPRPVQTCSVGYPSPRLVGKWAVDLSLKAFYWPQRSCGQGNIFTSCLSFCSQGVGVPASVHAGIPPPGADTPRPDPSGTRHPPGTRHPTPQDQTPPWDQTPP